MVLDQECVDSRKRVIVCMRMANGMGLTRDGGGASLLQCEICRLRRKSNFPDGNNLGSVYPKLASVCPMA